jgi:hypothetical protein
MRPEAVGGGENKFTFAALVGHVMGDQGVYNVFQKGETALGGGEVGVPGRSVD